VGRTRVADQVGRRRAEATSMLAGQSVRASTCSTVYPCASRPRAWSSHQSVPGSWLRTWTGNKRAVKPAGRYIADQLAGTGSAIEGMPARSARADSSSMKASARRWPRGQAARLDAVPDLPVLFSGRCHDDGAALVGATAFTATQQRQQRLRLDRERTHPCERCLSGLRRRPS
jgi:hypothetical protein